MQPKSYTATLLLSFFLGGLGIHRFYTGYIGFGILQLLTLGGCGLWSLIDFICICFNNYKTADGQPLAEYNKILGMSMFGIWIAMFLIGVVCNSAVIITALRG